MLQQKIIRVYDDTSELRGHNVTCDNFFTLYNLGQLLLKRKLTMVGTVRKNKPELPQPITNKEVHSSSFLFTNNTTVVNYVPKKGKNVILMSTLHHDNKVAERTDQKPHIILDYNATKGAVDTLDQLVGTYTCKRKSNRWPLVIFYNMLDISAYNAYVLWTAVNPNWNNNNLTKRRLFLEELGKSLIKLHMESRTYLPRGEEARNLVVKAQQSKNRNIALTSNEPSTAANINAKRARCKFCPSSNDNKTNITCVICNKHLCKKHVKFFCPNCAT